jgi:hypothetical protein
MYSNQITSNSEHKVRYFVKIINGNLFIMDNNGEFFL